MSFGRVLCISCVVSAGLMAPATLLHRIILRPESRLRKVTAASVLEEILDVVPVPTAQDAQSEAGWS